MTPGEGVVPVCPDYLLATERDLLGAMLVSPVAVEQGIEMGLGVGAFYRPQHEWIYEAIRALRERAVPVDPHTVAAELDRCGRLEAAGGHAKLTTLACEVPHTANAMSWARQIREAAAR